MPLAKVSLKWESGYKSNKTFTGFICRKQQNSDGRNQSFK